MSEISLSYEMFRGVNCRVPSFSLIGLESVSGSCSPLVQLDL